MKSNKSILLYGGSYNPIHQGHLNAVLNAQEVLKCDEIWLIPRKYNYDGTLLLSGKDRINMIKLATASFKNIKICDVELKDENKELIYTYNTAKILVNSHKNYNFYFLIGADQLNNLPHWYEVDKLTKLFHFVCYQRPGYPINQEIVNKYNVSVVNGKQIEVSSTLIRSGVFSNIDESIVKYIYKHQLYLKERVMPYLSETRFIHVLSTAHLAKKIAYALNVDTNRAYVAGILHDIAKGKTNEEIYSIVKQYFPRKANYPKYSLHAYASEYIAKEEFKITDKKILKAIRNHARPCKNMSTLDKIIYCADKLEETRQFANKMDTIREMAFIDINKCFILTMEDQVNYLKANNLKIDVNTCKMIEYYKGLLNDENINNCSHD